MSQFSVRDGVIGVLTVAAALLLVALLGMAGLAAALAALIVASADPTGGRTDRVRTALAVTVVGAGLTLLGVLAGDAGWSATVLITAVTFVASMVAVYGKDVASAAYLLNLWVVLTLLFSAGDHNAAAFTVAFAIGGLLTTAVIRFRHAPTAPENGEPHEHQALREQLTLSSPVFRFALLRAAAVGLATAIGYALFPEHAFWMLLTTFLVIKPQRAATIRAGAQRAAGTIAGILVAMAVTETVDDTAALLAAFVLASFGMMAVKKASYTLFTLFLTVVVVLSVALVQGDSYETGWQRLLATVLGVGLALGIVSLSILWDHRAPSQRP